MRRVLLIALSALGCGPLAGIDDKEYVEVIALSGLNCTTCAVRSDGSVWCWGANERRQLGKDVVSFGKPIQVPLEHRMRSVSVGTTHVCAVSEDDRVWCWGGNATGQASPADFQLPECGAKETLDECLQKLFFDWVPPTEVELPPVAEVAAGQLHTCARTVDKQVYCWGSNHAGQCGRPLGDLFPREPGAGDACGWSTETVVAALASSSGSLLGGPQLVEGLDNVDELVAQRHTTCALVDAAVSCWGGNCGTGGEGLESLLGNDCSDGGQLGVSPHDKCFSDVPIPVGLFDSATHVNLAHISGFASLTDTSTGVKSWGWDGGQLGHGAPTDEFSVPKLVADLSVVDSVARTNGWHQYAHTSDGYYSWGINHCGELGQKDEISVSTVARRADAIPKSAHSLVSGQDHACYVAGGRVYCFGHELYIGQLLDFEVTCATEGDGCADPRDPEEVRFE